MTGSRDWPDPSAVSRVLDAAFDEAFVNGTTEFVVVHGACPSGADQHASEWVAAMNEGDFGFVVSEERHPAAERNMRMVTTRPDLCLAFIGDCTSPRCYREDRHPSHGASGCANLASGHGIPTRRYKPTADDPRAAVAGTSEGA